MSVLIPEYEPIPTRLYRLRWVFQYSDGKAEKRGIWDGNSDLPADSAWAVNKENLARVLIEGEDRLHNPGETKILLDCDGQDYASMQWEAYSKTPGFFSGPGFSPRTYISGLSILTREEKITVWVNGRVERAPLGEHDRTWDIHEHSLGSG